MCAAAAACCIVGSRIDHRRDTLNGIERVVIGGDARGQQVGSSDGRSVKRKAFNSVDLVRAIGTSRTIVNDRIERTVEVRAAGDRVIVAITREDHRVTGAGTDDVRSGQSDIGTAGRTHVGVVVEVRSAGGDRCRTEV